METFRNPMACFTELKMTANALALTRRHEVPGTIPLG
jgi:hypothetical protein